MHSSQSNQEQAWHKIPVIPGVATKVTLIVKYVCLMSLLFYATYYNCNCHHDISIVVIKYY
jgi:hypothetical protein